MKSHTIILSIALLILLPSCSGNSDSPVAPNPAESTSSNTSTQPVDGNDPQLWGFWDVEWNENSGNFDIVPLRSAEFAVNVIKFINASPANLILNVNSITPEPGGYTTFDVDIGLRHPFPGLDRYIGFDVMGVFMGNGSSQYPGADGYAVGGPNDQQMLNPDGFTRRFNAPEFSGAGQILPLQGYIPGAKGSPGYTPTSVINPYKYYADGLDANSDAFTFLVTSEDNRGSFHPGNTNFRNFKIRMPDTLKKFQYAVVANWEPNVNHPDPPTSLDDFPSSANSQEAVAIKILDTTDAFYVDESTYGGDINLDLTPWDWSAEYGNSMQEYVIKLYSPAWTGAYDVNMTPIAQAEHRYTFNATIPASQLIANGDLPVWIEVKYPVYDYTSPIGVPNDASGSLSAYFKTDVNIMDHDPGVVYDNFVYGIADSNFFTTPENGDTLILVSNMLDLPLQGPNAQNKKVLYYAGRTDSIQTYWELGEFVESLGYDWELVQYDPSTPLQYLDTTGVKMLFIAVFTVNSSIEPFTQNEIQSIKNLLNGGGICIIVFENRFCYQEPYDTHLLDQMLSELEVDFTYPGLFVLNTYPYTDFTPDPILENVESLYSEGASGEWTVFGDGVSLVRGNDNGYVYTTICKSPWKG